MTAHICKILAVLCQGQTNLSFHAKGTPLCMTKAKCFWQAEFYMFTHICSSSRY